ncbi:MAG TPA: S24 family peptidase [Patescibacteria group bacterium]|nr:S24 family peptidase [Patescibacteria group bacterium]
MSEEEHQQQDGVSVHAGFPNPATDQSLHTLDFNKLLIQHTSSTYMFRVHGNAWEDAGVFDNDIAVIDRALDPRQNDVILWWDENHGEFAISQYSALPKNSTCWGVVTTTIHQFRKNGLGKAHGKK